MSHYGFSFTKSASEKISNHSSVTGPKRPASRWIGSLTRGDQRPVSNVVAEPTVGGIAKQPAKLPAIHMDQLLMIARLEIDVSLLQQGVIHHSIHIVKQTGRRYSADRAIRKNARGLALGRQTEPPIQRPVKPAEMDAMRGWQYGEQVACLVFQHDGLGDLVTRNMRGSRALPGRLRTLVPDCLVVEVVGIEKRAKVCCNCHSVTLLVSEGFR